jgi:mRNA-degrading endonuclease toxin of MazEF toxin-antitoxin module
VVIPFTTEDIENIEPFEVLIQNSPENGLDKISKLQLNNPRVIDRIRLKKHLGVLSNQRIKELQQA